MRHILITIIFSIGLLTACVSAQKNDATVYQLFPTQNMWNFIKLNTRTGQMWQVQFDVKESNRLVSDLNLLPLVANEKEANNRFTLYPTQNMWTSFYLTNLMGEHGKFNGHSSLRKECLLESTKR